MLRVFLCLMLRFYPKRYDIQVLITVYATSVPSCFDGRNVFMALDFKIYTSETFERTLGTAPSADLIEP